MTSSRPATRPARLVNSLRRQFVPGGGVRVTPLEAALVVMLAAPLAFFRLGAAAVHARVWAEDGRIFLQQADIDGPFRAVTINYAGYLNAVPRLAAAFVHPFPVRWWGAGIHVADALVVAWVALVVYAGLSDHVRSRFGRGLAALYVVLVPVGPEITGSIANIQWYLVVGAVVALLWTPRSWWGWSAICVTTLAVTTTSPLGAVVFGCALVRWGLQRGRGSLVVLLVTAIGFAAQTAEMLHSPQREVANLLHEYGASGVARGYLARVAGDGVLGMDRLPAGMGTSVVAGAIVVLVLAAMVLVGLTRRWSGPWAVAALLLALSVGTYLLGVLLQPLPLPLGNAIVAGRYYSLPAQFLVLGLVVLGVGVLERRPISPKAGPMGVGERGARTALQLAVLALVGALGFGMITTYNEADLRGRNSTPTWSHSVRLAARTCQESPQRQRVTVPILPVSPMWVVRLRCSSLRSG
ncbi:hypothetical protein [uncultured Jatrophihabitans sp.]|uniref:hypothetical protein n=1 Tax=uncultured Jatrophihabitans sp. TaxID=1610747 RepID=UPI0035CBBE62